ncbi:nucleoside-diphosphate kinase [Anoxynatronum buryatiense]|uniref:Nucleoside diphosphate kinase n=1 Tax=Anoxynatronum buryatiense TaxID=489973 RepID=A0AA45WUB0_9CLOT|nr:nucleoside-diphosphate kinase [Anoxynatronum buryatiense]SMP45867.1 nucleoside diphosphate kinase [Anoxynatronum buryatiense]
MNQTLVVIKPQAVARGLSGKIMARYEEKGLKLAAVKLMQAERDLLAQHYAEHAGKSFYDNLLETMGSGPVLAMVLEGTDAVTAVRMLNGATDPLKASPGTIRGDFGLEMAHNVVHASDSIQSSQREISLWFPELAVK